MSFKGVSLKVGLVKRNILHYRYQMPSTGLLTYILTTLFFLPNCQLAAAKHNNHFNEHNLNAQPPARIFSYLIKDEAELFPGQLACNQGGHMSKLVSGENILSQLSDYFHYLSRAASVRESEGLWTSPYLDAFGLGLVVTHAIPAISRREQKTIGVAGVDLTMEEIETVLTRYQWGGVTSFLIDREGQTIYHPLLKARTTLLEDPIFVPIQQLEQDKDGNPREFSELLVQMSKGETGQMHIREGRRGTPKGDYQAGVRFDIMPLSYYFGPLHDSNYTIVFVLSEADK
ncbi:unnamed protein product [Protopolystoma xenopodis]|uniref:Cache domain-containing protein n=1 Tax=Protopolystoma xenopodis TaxID=117903 RepID=A0A448WPS0_9PLAT|nr:unnamed protein product [Protopolystoma xenopodis]